MLETMRPPAEADEFDDDTLAALGADDLVYHVWGGDWCGDCRAQLPAFASALAAAGVPGDRIHEYPVEKEADGSKTGEKVAEYGIELIPTVVVERDGEEVARFVEEAEVDIATDLAAQLS